MIQCKHYRSTDTEHLLNEIVFSADNLCPYSILIYMEIVNALQLQRVYLNLIQIIFPKWAIFAFLRTICK